MCSFFEGKFGTNHWSEQRRQKMPLFIDSCLQEQTLFLAREERALNIVWNIFTVLLTFLYAELRKYRERYKHLLKL